MDPLTIAILTAVGRIGIEAVISFLENRGASVEDAIAALKLAKDKSLDQYIAEDAAAKLKALPRLPGP